MLPSRDRRRFLKGAAAAGAAVGLSDLSFLAGLPPVSAADLQPLPGVVPLRAEIEPLVRLLEDTPRNRLLEEVAVRVRGGLAYRDLLAALLLAGVRNVQPRPSVGFKFHAVLAVNSVHLAATASPESERWLPLSGRFFEHDSSLPASLDAIDDFDGWWPKNGGSDMVLHVAEIASRVPRLDPRSDLAEDLVPDTKSLGGLVADGRENGVDATGRHADQAFASWGVRQDRKPSTKEDLEDSLVDDDLLEAIIQPCPGPGTFGWNDRGECN